MGLLVEAAVQGVEDCDASIKKISLFTQLQVGSISFDF